MINTYNKRREHEKLSQYYNRLTKKNNLVAENEEKNKQKPQVLKSKYLIKEPQPNPFFLQPEAFESPFPIAEKSNIFKTFPYS
jgi:hypothetical protein